MSKKLRWALGLGLGIPLALLASIIGSEFRPPPIMDIEAQGDSELKIPVNKDITLVSWNIQFCGSRKHQFFYDHGKAVFVPKEDVLETQESIRALLLNEGADISLLQEIDRFSDRTQNIDQLETLRNYLKGLSWMVTPYHKVAYVPHPQHEPMGRVNLNLGIISRYQLLNGKRHQLALLDEPRWRQYFNLKRALLESSIPLDGQIGTLKIAVTHLSAFSHGDGTLDKQVAQLKEWMESQPPDQAWILAGDFNLLPPNDYLPRLKEDAELYSDAKNPIEALIPKFKTAFVEHLAAKNYTYLPFGAKEPDRKIDYIFYGGPIEIKSALILRYASDISDHLPLKITFQIKQEDF